MSLLSNKTFLCSTWQHQCNSLFVWEAASTSRIKYSNSSPQVGLWCPNCVQWVSLIPSRVSLCLRTSVAIWMTNLVSYIIRIFRVPILIVALVISRSSVSWISKTHSFCHELWNASIQRSFNSYGKFKWFLYGCHFFSDFYGMEFLALYPSLYIHGGSEVAIAPMGSR